MADKSYLPPNFQISVVPLITHHRRGGSGGGDAEGDGDDGDLDLNNIDLEPATPEHVKPAGKFVFKRS